uniref:hypothetical protein n=1 Tax=Stappia sp. TaxID=1870903 RepID=UPI003BAA756A
MISDARQGHETAQAEPAAMLRTFFDDLRRDLGRYDLDDATLESAVAEVAGHPNVTGDGAGDKPLVERMNAGRIDAALRRRLAENLCLPAPRAPMTMPVQTLERARPSLLPRLAGLRLLARRRRIGER